MEGNEGGVSWEAMREGAGEVGIPLRVWSRGDWKFGRSGGAWDTFASLESRGWTLGRSGGGWDTFAILESGGLNARQLSNIRVMSATNALRHVYCLASTFCCIVWRSGVTVGMVGQGRIRPPTFGMMDGWDGSPHTHGGGNNVKVLGASLLFRDGRYEWPGLLVVLNGLKRSPAEGQVLPRQAARCRDRHLRTSSWNNKQNHPGDVEHPGGQAYRMRGLGPESRGRGTAPIREHDNS